MTSTLNSPSPLIGVPQRPMTRSTAGALLGGVCAGLAVRLGVRERTVRVFFVVTCLLYGLGTLLYAAAWMFVTRWGEDVSIARRLTRSRRESNLVLVGLLVSLLMLLSLGAFARHGAGVVVWPVLLSAVALIAIWAGSSRDEKARLEELAGAIPVLGAASAHGWRALALRVVPGVIFVILGLRLLSRIGGVVGAAVPAILGGSVLTLGVAILLAPWWLDNVRALSRERRDRIHAEERTKIAAHVHDSVLQTLTLIEKSANNPSDVVRLARSQERELRQWLFAPEHAGTREDANGSFAQQLRHIESDVENDYGVTVELVIVGDCPGDRMVAALSAATREAAINAAKWAKVSRISIFGEVESTSLSVYIRDTGIGFDPSRVANDRQGINQSIVGRIRSFGGDAQIRSQPGAGTEVHLTLSRLISVA